MTKTQDRDLMSELRDVTDRTLQSAGPRYGPSLDPGAPNLAVLSLQRAGCALAQGPGFSDRVRALGSDLRKGYEWDDDFAADLFGRRKVNFLSVIADIDALACAVSVDKRKTAMRDLRRHLRSVSKVFSTAEDRLRERLLELGRTSPDAETEEQKDARSKERERVQSSRSRIRRLNDALHEVVEFANGHEGELAATGRSVLLLGEWGTGKTHFLCDFANQSLNDGTPALVVLANVLRTDIPPLDAVAEVTGLASNGAELLSILGAKATELGRRALIMIDALNESDRDAWRRALPKLVREVAKAGSVGLVVSCRTPFDSSVATNEVRKQMIVLYHPGFEEQEFDAQLEFFRYYDLPALHVPLLTGEFSRPLFLRLMCEGIKDLGKRSQKDRLRDLASGQKSMTYVLERFVKEVGAEVEKAHTMPRLSSWHIMKGEPRQGHPGFAGVLARERREWLTRDEAIGEVRAHLNGTAQQAADVIDSMKTAGLLIEHSRYRDGAYVDVLVLPYQRFSDHLVARHLLDTYLDTSSTTKMRRCFYKNQPLGSVFLLDRWGHEFAEPGIASALMIEFPERVRRKAERENAPRELFAYLPKERRLVEPIAEVFLEGLYWRPSSSFDAQTERLVEFFLRRPEPEICSLAYEVLIGLSMRDAHPLGSSWLIGRLSRMSMPERDIEWSEFVRTAESDSNLHRLLVWAEREDHTKVDPQVTRQALLVTTMLLTTTDRHIRDRATRALVLMGEAHPARLFDEVRLIVSLGDPYITERVLAACYGVCMRVWADGKNQLAFGDALVRLSQVLLEEVLRKEAPHSTWHALTRGYAIGVLHVLRVLRPRALAAPDRQLLNPSRGQGASPFRPVSQIRKRDIEDPEHAIHMDFGNYTIGRLVRGRGNYDFKHREYAGVRRQIADRMRMLGYSTARFSEIDKNIVRYSEYSREEYAADRYGKKYSWIAYFEMYGLRQAQGKLTHEYFHEPRPSDSDIDPSFPSDIPRWMPPHRDIFAESPVELHGWIAEGLDPDYASIMRMSKVDGLSGDWILLDAAIHEAAGDGREARGWLTSIFAPPRSVKQLRREVESGRTLRDGGIPDSGSDYYTYHGEVPWSEMYGSDVRTQRGYPKLLNDRAFDYFSNSWRDGVPVENACRYWSWEDHHSQLNQVGSVIFPAPPLATLLRLRSAHGSSDMLDEKGRLATIFRRADGPGFGSYFLYMRKDLVEFYESRRNLRLIQAVVGERSINYKVTERAMPDSLLAVLQSRIQVTERIFGLYD